jgi:predicted ATPase
VVTGGPGAGKTAVLEMIRQYFCSHVRVLPEAAGIVFGGGFPREQKVESCQAAQRAIFHVQHLEIVGDAHDAAIVVCDRGTIDGVAYWPGAVVDFWPSRQTSLEREIARYDAVIHMRTPGLDSGYNYQNPLRTESAVIAAEIDARILDIWASHPRRFVVDASANFFDKATRAIAMLGNELPDCCRRNVGQVLEKGAIGS